MALPSADDIKATFTRDPASFRFEEGAHRIVGGREGAAIQIDGPADAPTEISMAVVLPPDNETMARRGGILIILFLTVLDRDWGTGAGGDWLNGQLRIAAYDARLVMTSEREHNGRTYTLITDKKRSLATIRVR